MGHGGEFWQNVVHCRREWQRHFSILALRTPRTVWRGKKEALTRHWISQQFDLGLLASRTIRNKYLLCKLLSLWYFVIAAWAKTRLRILTTFKRKAQCPWLKCWEMLMGHFSSQASPFLEGQSPSNCFICIFVFLPWGEAYHWFLLETYKHMPLWKPTFLGRKPFFFFLFTWLCPCEIIFVFLCHMYICLLPKINSLQKAPHLNFHPHINYISLPPFRMQGMIFIQFPPGKWKRAHFSSSA